jgi:hypothetical protein
MRGGSDLLDQAIDRATQAWLATPPDPLFASRVLDGLPDRPRAWRWPARAWVAWCGAAAVLALAVAGSVRSSRAPAAARLSSRPLAVPVNGLAGLSPALDAAGLLRAAVAALPTTQAPRPYPFVREALAIEDWRLSPLALPDAVGVEEIGIAPILLGEAAVMPLRLSDLSVDALTVDGR